MHPKTDVNSFGHTSNNCEIYQCSVVHVQNIQAKALLHPQGGRKQWHSEHIPISRKNSEQNKYTCTKCPTSTRFNSTLQGSHSDWKTWKTWKNGKAFSSQGKVREFWTDWKSHGKVRENHTKYWKTQGIWDKYYLIFFVIFKWTVYYLPKWIKFSVKKNKTLKKYWKNGKKYWKSQGKVREFCQSKKVGTLSHFSIAKFNKCQIRSFWTTWTCFSCCFFFAFSGVTYQTERWTNFTKKGHQRRATMLNRWIKLGISLTELVIAARGIN